MLEKLKESWEGLQARERVLLLLMFGVFGSLGIFIVTVMVSSSFDEKAGEIEKYREALYYLEDHQHDYLANKSEKDRLREKLANNDLQVGTYLNQAASDLGFDVNVSPKDPRPATGDDGEGVEETEFEVTIKTVERDALLEFLWSIEQSEAPIFIRRINLRRARGRGAGDRTETPLTGSMTVVSFRLKD